MSLWERVRGLRWGWKLALGLVGVPLALVLLYVAGRSTQYLVAEGDAGRYAPASVHVLARVKDLDVQLARLEKSFAWTTLERKILRDPAVRPRVNAALKDAGLPTLDQLDDPRKRGQFSRENLSRFAGRDALVGVGERDAFCAVTRLGWLEYLATPFAPLVLSRDGDTLKAGKKLWVAFAGSLAIAGSDKALVEEALRGRGRPPEGKRPLEAVVRFEGSFARYRNLIADAGLALDVDLRSAKGARISADLEGSAARIDVVLEGVEAKPERSTPRALLARAPSSTTGVFASSLAFPDVYAWASRTLGASLNGRQALETLEKGGLSDTLLPLLEPGIALITGYQENEGRLYPTLALLVKTRDAAAAEAALTGIVKKIGGKFGEARFEERPVGDSLMRSVRWPESAGINDFLQPCWAAVEGGLLFGNNPAFVEALLTGGDPWSERRVSKKLSARLKELGFSEAATRAQGRLLPPLLKESLDGVINYAARVMAVPSDALLRQSLEREWAEQGRGGMPEPEKAALFHEAREAKVREFEVEARRDLRVLEPVRWMAVESSDVPGGVSLRLALGFDTLSDR